MCRSCGTCRNLDRGKIIYNGINKTKFKCGCSIRKYTPFWIKEEQQLVNCTCEAYDLKENATGCSKEIFFEKDATFCGAGNENVVKYNNSETIKETRAPGDRKPIPKDGQLKGQVDIFNLELWKV